LSVVFSKWFAQMLWYAIYYILKAQYTILK
jgi:hypothetical protein